MIRLAFFLALLSAAFLSSGQLTVVSNACEDPAHSPKSTDVECNAGIATSPVSAYCCAELVEVEALGISICEQHTIGWALSTTSITDESELSGAMVLSEKGASISIAADCDNMPQEGFLLTPFVAVNDFTYAYVFEDTIQEYWSSSATISLDLSNAQIPYDAAYGNLIELEIVNLSSVFDDNGGTSNFIVESGIGGTHEEFGVPTLPPGENTLQCTWMNDPNTTFDVTCQDATDGIGGEFIVRLNVFVPFPTIDPFCTSLGEPVSILVSSQYCCAGDFDGDGIVSIPDLLLLLGNFGCSENCFADLDSDDLVSIGDLAVFLGLIGILCE